MPSPRDITGDLVRLRNKKALHEAPSGEAPLPRRFSDLQTRPMAPDPILWISGLVILCGLAVQSALVLWML